ncbi:hypothetical protein [uncultured Paludibaculum sp.]|uniref:hypothetical protein n=1 Tax=uncultured Paludibaculum sp. TaxID=1765020 RepID=UPI002AAA9924|nr:hypothetical protein [uncultured Paludibaculum sp.]
MRGRIALAEGAIQSSQLTADGRDASPADQRAWHLLSLDWDDSVVGCVRMLVHPCRARFESLMVSHTKLATSPDTSSALRSAVESEMQRAQMAGAPVVEVGGWVLDESVRGSVEAIRLALGVWAWGRLLGGAIGIATATVRNSSAHMLGRIGGRPLEHDGAALPPYFEPKYGCDIQMLRFDSNSFTRRFAPIVESMCSELCQSPVFSTVDQSTSSLLALCAAIQAHQPQPMLAGFAS